MLQHPRDDEKGKFSRWEEIYMIFYFLDEPPDSGVNFSPSEMRELLHPVKPTCYMYMSLTNDFVPAGFIPLQISEWKRLSAGSL